MTTIEDGLVELVAKADELGHKLERFVERIFDALEGKPDRGPTSGQTFEEPATYRKLPVEIEAFLWDGSIDGIRKINEWSEGHVQFSLDMHGKAVAAWVSTLEGDMRIGKGDYIIRGVKGEYYPCKGTIFNETYEWMGE